MLTDPSLDTSAIHERHLTVRYSETGVNGTLKPVNILNYFQNIASDHSAEMGVSAMDLLPKGLAWVIFQYQIDVLRYPKWKEPLKLRTWRCPHKNLYELRQYEVFDQAGRLLISAKSSWVMTSLATKKPVRLNRHLPPEMISGRQQPVAADFPAVPELQRTDASRVFHARMHDLDFNRHVNNSVYVEWGIESVPREIIGCCRPAAVTAQYIGESLYGDPVTVNTQGIKNETSMDFLHSIVNGHTGKEITRLRTRWEPFE